MSAEVVASDAAEPLDRLTEDVGDRDLFWARNTLDDIKAMRDDLRAHAAEVAS